MPIRIKTFGKLTEILGSGQLELSSTAMNTDALKALLLQQFPVLADMKFFMAINNKMVQGNAAFEEGAIIALLPPFSGG